MPERLPDHPRLHALLGAAVRDLPAALAETLEDALRESAEFVTPSAFFAHLAGHGRNPRADGEAWSEILPEPRPRLRHGPGDPQHFGHYGVDCGTARCACGGESDDPACCPSAAVVEGLFNACQVLSLQVGAAWFHEGLRCGSCSVDARFPIVALEPCNGMPMHVMSHGRCLTLALAVAVSAGACARPPSTEHERNPAMSGAPQTGRTINGHTYTDAPVDVKLGPNTFRIPANYLDSQIAPWPGEGVTLVIEWPDMTPTPPGARANPRTNDFRKEIAVAIDYIDRAPIETSLERLSSTRHPPRKDR